MKVETGVPLPPEPMKGATAVLRALKPGESAHFPNLHAAALAFRILGRGHYRSRKERGGVRVWRL